MDYAAPAEFPVPGTALRLGDIALDHILRVGRHLDKQYAVALSVYKESTANMMDVATRVTNLINNDLKNDQTLQGMDQAKEILEGVNGIRSSGVVGGLLAAVVLFFFLRRFDATFIVSLAIPTSILAATLMLYALGKTLNEQGRNP